MRRFHPGDMLSGVGHIIRLSGFLQFIAFPPYP
jgi:hypothetical protein